MSYNIVNISDVSYTVHDGLTGVLCKDSIVVITITIIIIVIKVMINI